MLVGAAHLVATLLTAPLTATGAVPPDATLPPELVDACGDDPGTICERVLDSTDNEALAKTADWVIGRPLRIALILLTAWIVVVIGRRAVRRVVHRVIAADPERTLRKVGVSAGTARALADPRREARARSVSVVAASLVAVVVWTIAVILVLGELEIDLAPLIAGAGIAGIALGFGAQSLVKDCLTGVFMLVEDQYGIGDVVDLGEASGVVEKITLRTTVLRGTDGTVWHVPNGEVVRVGNRSQLWSVAVVDLLVAPDADIDLALQVLARTATEVAESEAFADTVLEAPHVTGVEAVDINGITLRVLVKTQPGEQAPLQREIRAQTMAAFERAGVSLPYPATMWSRIVGQTAADPPPTNPT